MRIKRDDNYTCIFDECSADDKETVHAFALKNMMFGSCLIDPIKARHQQEHDD